MWYFMAVGLCFWYHFHQNVLDARRIRGESGADAESSQGVRIVSRRSLSWITDYSCYHVTQRCQERRFLLRFKKDRRQYLQRLREAIEKYPVSVLNYMITSNHVHLLVHAGRAAHLSAAMQYVSGCIAQDYNRRKSREGAFWSGRFRPTLIQPGHHFSRCFFYISLNMLRAAGQVPGEWVGDSHAELTGQAPGPNSIIDREVLFDSLECGSPRCFSAWYGATLREELERGSAVREHFWTESAAVGDKLWLDALTGGWPTPWYTIEPSAPVPAGGAAGVSETSGTYVLRISDRRREGLLSSVRQ